MCNSFQPVHGALSGFQPYTVGLLPIPNSIKFSFSWTNQGDPLFEIFRSDVCSPRYDVKHASLLRIYSLHECVHACRYVKIVESIHWTPLGNFNFLHHPKIQHCLKAITKYRLTHACVCILCECCVCIHTHRLPKIFLVHP